MKKISCSTYAISIAICIFAFSSLSLAMDTGACLFCHQYPGLVKSEDNDKFKILHINEEKYRESAHGKINCNECHTKVTQVPHTDVTETDCTTKCHIEDRDKILATKPAALKSFHKDEKFSITNLEDKSSCRACHPLYPHSKNRMVRAFVNIHTGYLLCEVCHLKKEHRTGVYYDWSAPEYVEFQGKPYGTHTAEKEKSSSENIIAGVLQIFSSGEDESEGRDKARYTISRIVPYTLSGGKKTFILNGDDASKAEKFKKKEKDLKPGERQERLDYFHRNIAKKEISVACSECHSPDGVLDFVKLGFDEKTAKDLQYLNIKGLVTKYETFYFPNLFGN
jgi:hypothetical protein